MGEHATWFDFLPGYRNLETYLGAHLGRTWKWQIFQESHFSLAHVAGTLLVVLFLLYGALRYRAALGSADARIVPPAEFGIRNLFEVFTEAFYGLMQQVLGPKEARRYLPFVGSLAFIIFFSNLLALIPGFLPPTSTLKTNLALSIPVFVMTHYYGVREHGVAYLKHFIGPVWWLAPLLLPIELISHMVRPVSLAVRLMVNMAADHMILAAFFGLVPLLVPVPFLVLGVLVVVIQTMVFCILTMVYISIATAHEEH